MATIGIILVTTLLLCTRRQITLHWKRSDVYRTVQVDWVRHGYSCGNVKQIHRKDMLTSWKTQTPNPFLTDLGIEQCKRALDATNGTHQKLSERLNCTDLVFCSSLLRTMETAINMFPTIKNIYVIPYVHEKPKSTIGVRCHVDKENRPPSLSEIKETVCKELNALGYADEVIDKLNYSIYEDIIRSNYYQAPSFQKFLQKLMIERWWNKDSHFNFKKLLHTSNQTKHNTINSNTIKIAIVSHSNYLQLVADVTNENRNIALSAKENNKTNPLFDQTPEYKLPTERVIEGAKITKISGTGIMNITLNQEDVVKYVQGSTNIICKAFPRLIYQWRGFDKVRVNIEDSGMVNTNDLSEKDYERCPDAQKQKIKATAIHH